MGEGPVSKAGKKRSGTREEELERRVAKRTEELEREKRKLNRLIRESRTAAARLLESEARFRETAELLPTMICETDLDGNFTYFNRLGMECLGLEIADMGGSANLLEDFIVEADRGRAYQDMMALLRGQQAASNEYRLCTRDGDLVHAAVRSSPICQDDQIVGMRSTITDQTPEIALQAQLSQTDRMASVGLLAAGVAHEINNPLTYLLFNLEASSRALPQIASALTSLQLGLGVEESVRLMGKDASAAGAEGLSDLVNQIDEALHGARRVQTIVKDLKTFARADDDRFVPVSINDVLEGAINMAFNEIKYRARLEKDLGDLPTLMANDGKLAQVFLNLLVNAAQAIEEGHVEQNKIRVRTWLELDRVCIEVADSGNGISEADLERIFDPFYSTKEVGVGSGLGLSICRSIVEGFDGKIEAKSVKGKGTSFQVSLPVRLEEVKVPSVHEISTEEIKPPQRVRVLMVDDEVQIARAIKRMLAGAYDVTLAGSGAEAQEHLRPWQKFDIIICDLMMPELSGMDLYDWVKENRPELAPRMIFITGGAFTPRARTFFNTVRNPCLEKPFSARDLRTLLKEQVG